MRDEENEKRLFKNFSRNGCDQRAIQKFRMLILSTLGLEGIIMDSFSMQLFVFLDFWVSLIGSSSKLFKRTLNEFEIKDP